MPLDRDEHWDIQLWPDPRSKLKIDGYSYQRIGGAIVGLYVLSS